VETSDTQLASHTLLRKTVLVVATLNIAYFAVEFGVGRWIGSVALFADSVDFLEDASVNILVFFAIGFTAIYRRIVGLCFVGLLIVPSLAALYTAWDKFAHPSIADPALLTLTAFGALLVNGTCAYLLARVRQTGGSLSKAAFLSARNDMAANVAMIVAGGLTAATLSIWPDVIVGLGIAALNATAAFEVYEAALAETPGLEPTP
jgi:Co/Zn/Cd efflux system component